MPEQEWTPRVRRVNSGGRERLQYVMSLMREQRHDEAQEELHAILEQDGRSVPARMMLGSLYLGQERTADALEQFKRVIQTDPTQAQAFVRAGTCCVRLDDLDQAKELLQRALDLDPKQARAHFGMAQVLVQAGETAEAISHLDEALRLDPQMAPARMMVARLLSQSGNVDGAIEELHGVLNVNPDSAQAALRLAMMQRRKGENDKAVAVLENAAKAHPESDRVWDMLGQAKMAVMNYEGAEEAFVEAAKLKTDGHTAQLRLVKALIMQNKLDEAQDMLKNLPRRGRMASFLYEYYGDIFSAKMHYNEAIDSYRAALLHIENGEQVLTEVDAGMEPGADNRSRISRFQAAIVKLREEERARRQEEGADRNVRSRSGARRRGGGSPFGPGRRRPGAGPRSDNGRTGGAG